MIGELADKIDGMGAMLGKPLYVQDLAPREVYASSFFEALMLMPRSWKISTEAALGIEGCRMRPHL